jgi:hypothetical protein
MSKTSMMIFHINDKYSIGFHPCAGAPELYFQQSAGDVYNCFARHKKITDKSTIIDIFVIGFNVELVHVVPNGDYIEKWKSNLSFDDFLRAKVDTIDVIHDNYKIKHYLPYPQIELDEETRRTFYDDYKSFIDKKSINEIHNVKCLIWKVIKDEERAERNKRFLN